ncbi:hypothetical protein DAPPUDRAFT_300124 [Daphnia pulex]|uniref:O-acyltransferase n=1 Tax=Daphnia pulex TaxID=6669 RepID=E9FR08_DAPPU|nr:hypothetical protein DAPPUDRAFT_300124 [Daphnia pulex]|eukprot:EFX90273.1 hypothetical protein DAPPUDRAFT_300124 [Daphnia pulex]
MVPSEPIPTQTVNSLSTDEIDGKKSVTYLVDDRRQNLRLRRTKSVARAEEITKEAEKVRKSQPDKPCHKPRDSLFSWSSEFRDFTGLVNWGFLLLFMGGLRLSLENLLKYGIRIDPIQWIIVLNGGTAEFSIENPSVYLFIYINVHILFTLWVEKLLAKERIRWNQALLLHICNLSLIIMIPVISSWTLKNKFGLVGLTLLCTVYTITFLKLWSYIHVNYWCRLVRSKSQQHRRRAFSVAQPYPPDVDNGKSMNEVVSYPNNLTVHDLYFFMAVPTLCYELNFPRTSRIRKRFLIKRVIEVLVGMQVVLGLFQQWIIPSVKNSLETFSKMEPVPATERLLKLAIPNHLLWLIWFYLCFHSYFNMLGEVLKFADRDFYGDWWNATNIDVFWRSWNMPIHRWAVRHLYMPLIERGYGKTVGSVSVFLLSAFFHEYLVSVPLRMFNLWAFSGMMLQIPLSAVSHFVEKKAGPRLGNVLVWMSLILGQPLCIMMYYHDYVITHFGKDLMEQFSKMR